MGMGMGKMIFVNFLPGNQELRGGRQEREDRNGQRG